MKTIKRQAKFLALAIVLIFSISVYAQKKTETSNVFVRVYNLEGKKISKGPIVFINDSIIGLKNSSEKTRIHLKEIGFIKTKRSAGNNVLIGAVSGAVLLGVINVSTADENRYFSNNAEEGAILGGSFGAIGGGAIGGLTSLLKKSKTYMINANKSNWNSFQKTIEQK